jgi:hypothetical protein
MDSEFLILHDNNPVAELHRLRLRVSALVFDRHEYDGVDCDVHSQLQATEAAAEADAVNAELRAQLDAMQQDIRASDARTEQHGRRCATLEESLSRLQNEMMRAQQELADAVADRSQVCAERDALEAELSSLAVSRDELDRRLTASSVALVDSEAASCVLVQERDLISARLEDAKQQLSDAHERLTRSAEADAVNAELRSPFGPIPNLFSLDHTVSAQHCPSCALLQDSFNKLHFELVSTQQARDNSEAEVVNLIHLRLKESNAALLESQEAARNFKLYCDIIENKSIKAQQELSDAHQQMKAAALEAEAANGELRAQLVKLQQELGTGKM